MHTTKRLWQQNPNRVDKYGNLNRQGGRSGGGMEYTILVTVVTVMGSIGFALLTDMLIQEYFVEIMSMCDWIAAGGFRDLVES
jgi:hypothetical protein